MRTAPLVLALCLLASARAAVAADLPPELKDLVAEGRKWFRVAGNTDLGTADRNAARVNAWKSLWPAREILDRHDEEHPEDMDRVDREYGEVRMMVHWLKKESPVGLLEGTGVGPGKDADEAPSPTADWGAKPKDPPAPPPGTPAPSPGTPAPPAATPAAPAEPTIDDWFAAAEGYESKHRVDIPGVHARYMAVVTRFPDPSHPLFQKAAEKAGSLEGRLKDAYRVLRDEDPDSLKGIESEQVRRMVITVSRDLRSADGALRERAARLLGLLGRVEAVYALGQALKKEGEEVPARAMGEALVNIGGAKAADALGDLRDDQGASAFEHLLAMAKRNAVDRRFAVTHLGRFGGAQDYSVFQRMVAELKTMGYDGTVGLVEAIRYTNNPKRLEEILAPLGTMGVPAAARVLAGLLQPSRNAADDRVRAAAENAIRTMAKKENLGEAVVPFLFEGLRHTRTRYHATLLLQELTGQEFSVKQWGRWKDWWKAKHPDWKE